MTADRAVQQPWLETEIEDSAAQHPPARDRRLCRLGSPGGKAGDQALAAMRDILTGKGEKAVASSIRVVFEFKRGPPHWQASDEENERSDKVGMGMWEKWKADPAIRYICYYLRPHTCHHFVFEVDDFSKVEEMDQDVNTATRAGWLVDHTRLDIVLGRPGFDEFWAS